MSQSRESSALDHQTDLPLRIIVARHPFPEGKRDKAQEAAKKDPKAKDLLATQDAVKDTEHDGLEFVAWLARSTDVRVRVVTSFVRPWPAASISSLGTKYKKWLKKQERDTRQQVAEELAGAGIDKRHRDENYSVFMDGTSETPLLIRQAKEFHADLIILGSDISAAKGHFLTTSTAESLLHYSPTPLGLTPRKVKLSKRGVTRVNFAYLSSDTGESYEALRYAADLAVRFGASLRILGITPAGMMDGSLLELDKLVHEMNNEWREHALSMLDQASDKVLEFYPDLPVETGLASGHGWDGALASVKWKKGDLLCLGSQDSGPLKRVFIGSAASELLPYVEVPILVHHERA